MYDATAGAGFLLLFLVYLAPVIFTIWFCVQVVKQLRRIATALEGGATSNNTSATSSGKRASANSPEEAQRRREASDPAYKYISKK